jgi:O-antigen/teichoic acid export membrane protein
MSLRSEIATGLKWEAINVASRQILSLIVFTTLARLLGPETFGLMGLVFVYTGLVGMITEQGITTALIQRKNLKQQHIDSAFWLSLGLALSFCLITTTISEIIAEIFKEPELASLINWASIGLIFNSLSTVQSALLVKELRFRELAIRTLLATTTGGAVGITMAYAGYGIWSLVAQQLTVALSGSLFVWIISAHKPCLRFSNRHILDLVLVGIPVLGSNILYYISSKLDHILIGRFMGTSSLGIYVVAGKIPQMASTMTHRPLARVALPALSQVQGDKRRVCNLIYEGMTLTATITFAIFIGLALVSSDVLGSFFGEKWLTASVPASLLSIYALVTILKIFFHPALLAAGLIGKYFIINLYSFAGAAISCFIGIQFGINYLIIGLITNGLAMTVPPLILLKREVNLSITSFFKTCKFPALAAIAMSGSVFLIEHFANHNIIPLLRLAIKTIIGAAVYIGFIYVFDRSSIQKFLTIAASSVKSTPTDTSMTTS